MSEAKRGAFIGVYNRVRGFIDDTKNLLYRQQTQQQQIDGAQRYIPYGINDAFPFKLAKSIQDSVTASSCLNAYAKFVRGSQFSDPELAKKVVNSFGETLWQVHNKVSQAFSSFRGFAICVKYSASADIVGFYSVPFQYFRLREPDEQGIISKVLYNPFFGTGQDQTHDTKEWDLFNPNKEVVAKQIAEQKSKFKGQILYYGETTPLSPFYPYPVFASAINWMAIEAAIATFHKENLDNGFFQSVLLRIIGDPTAESTHPDDVQIQSDGTTKSIRSVGARFNLEMQKFSGAERVGNIMVQWAAQRDEWPDIQAFPTNANQELFTNLSNEAINKITLSFNVPSILANIQSGASLGGDGNLIRVSVKLMQSRVLDDQMVLEQTYDKLLANMKVATPVKINNYNPYPELEPIDKDIWATLSQEEKRKYIKENTKYPILETSVQEPATPTNSNPGIVNALWTDYPEQAKKNASRALAIKDNMGCGTKNGWIRAEEISKGMPLPYKEVKRIYNYLKKTSWADNKLMNESCDALLFNAWGGKPMLEWAADKIKSVEL